MSENYQIEKKYDLEQFINTEIKIYSNGDINLSKIFKYYYKCQSRILFEIYDKLKNLCEKEMYQIIQYGSNMVNHIFWILYSYSLNIKLTMFLTERAILLFTEFIIMSKNPLLNKEFRFMPSINDAFCFSIKKTIGPIKNKCNTKNKKFIKELNKYKMISVNMKYLLQQLLTSIINNKKIKNNIINNEDIQTIYDYDSIYINSEKDITDFLETCSSIYYQTLYNLYNYDKICFDILVSYFKNTDKDLTLQVSICKLSLDLIYEVNLNIKDIYKSKILVEKYLSQNEIDMEEFKIYNIKNLKKKNIFKDIYNKILDISNK